MTPINPRIAQPGNYTCALIALDVFDSLCCIFAPKISPFRANQHYVIEQIYADDLLGQKVIRIRIAEKCTMPGRWTKDSIEATLKDNTHIEISHTPPPNMRFDSALFVYSSDVGALGSVALPDGRKLVVAFVFHAGWFEIICVNLLAWAPYVDEYVVILQSIFTGAKVNLRLTNNA
jgi:hypothetical protein